MQRDAKRFLQTLFNELHWNEEQRREAIAKIERDLAVPARLIGIGQCGVGKTQLLRSIFNITDDDEAVLRRLRTGGTEATTKAFFSFQIQTPAGFRVEFTDGPGLGEDEALDERYLQLWIDEIPKHDLLYWVLDAASRDISHIQKNMRHVLDATGFRNRFVLVLNKVDNIQLEEADRAKGAAGWNDKFNVPSKKLLARIERRTADIIKKFVEKVGVPRDNIVACSALKRWNHDLVLDKMLELLPPEKRIKVAENRDVKSAADLMAPEVRQRIEAEIRAEGR